MAWTWDRERKRYRNSTTGRFIAQKQVLAWRDLYVDLRVGSTQALTKDMIDKTITRQQWELGMQEQISKDFTTLYMFGRGGKDAMTPADTARLERMVRQQNRYLQGFSRDVRRGQVSPAQALARSRMYIGAGTQAFETGRAAAFGLPNLSQYPGDGQTRCLSNCQCHLSYHQDDSNWLVYWNLGVAEHCPDCEALATDWNPLTIGAGGNARGQLPSWSGPAGSRDGTPLSRQELDAVRKWRASLSPAQAKALTEYQVGSYEMQKALLGDEALYRKHGAAIRRLVKALETAPKRPGVVWRGFGRPALTDRQIQQQWSRAVGTKVNWDAFASASNNPRIASMFSGDRGRAVFELRHLSGRAVMDLGMIFGIDEEEVLMPPGTSWRVEAVKKVKIAGDRGRRTLVILQEIL